MFTITIKPRMSELGIGSKETHSCLFSLVYLIVFLTKLLDGMFGLGMALKEILSHLFNPFNLKILDLYLETWLWLPLICAEKALHGRVDIWDYLKTYIFNNFVYFWYFLFFYYYLCYYIAIFISLNILLLPLLLVLKLITIFTIII